MIEIRINGDTAADVIQQLSVLTAGLSPTVTTLAPNTASAPSEAPAEPAKPARGKKGANEVLQDAARTTAAALGRGVPSVPTPLVTPTPTPEAPAPVQDAPEATEQDRADEKADSAEQAKGVVTQETVREAMGELKNVVGMDRLKEMLPKLFATDKVKKVSDLPNVPGVLNGVLVRVRAAMADPDAFLPAAEAPADDADY